MSGCVSLAERLELGGGKTITTASTWTRQLAGKHTGSQLWSSTSARSEAACSICKRIPSQLNAIADKWEKERTEIHQANTQENRNLLRHQVTATLFSLLLDFSLATNSSCSRRLAPHYLYMDCLCTVGNGLSGAQWQMAENGKWKRPAEAASWDGLLVHWKLLLRRAKVLFYFF